MSEKIKCPKCKNENLAITVQYKKATLWRILKFLSIIALLFTVILNMAEVIEYCKLDKNTQTVLETVSVIIPTSTTGSNQPFAVADTYKAMPLICLFLLMTTVFGIIEIYIEAKPRIFYVCKDCNECWYKHEETCENINIS